MHSLYGILIGYLFGWIEGALLISKIFGHFDIRDKGSGNAGASNVTNVMGWKYGIIVALIDILKAFIPMTLAKHIFHADTITVFAIGFGVILGHIYPLPMGFRGGKGLASLIGMSFALDWRLGLLMGLILILITVITDYIFFGSITLYLLLPVIIIMTGQDRLILTMAAVLAVIGVLKHRSNLSAFKRGEETGLRAVIHKHKK